jgi:5'-deoxynucleotidase YfbR-like HD superfamily hydrolase
MSALNVKSAILREASRVERSHTMPHHGSYTNGQHSYDMAMLLMLLYPTHSHNLMKAVLVHDIPERYMGDMPGPAKESDGELGKRIAIIETRVARSLGIEFELTNEERIWLKALDRTELLLWAKEQVAMGNQNAQTVIGRLASWFGRNRIPTPVAEFIQNHVWTRTPDEFPR